MKNTGIIRKVDELGRFVIPSILRETLKIDTGCQFEVSTDNGYIILEKYNNEEKRNKGAILRLVDELGRLVIPIKIRENYNIYEKTGLEIYLEEDIIILKKHEKTCVFCNGTNKLKKFKDKLVCSKCIDKLTSEKKSRSTNK